MDALLLSSCSTQLDAISIDVSFDHIVQALFGLGSYRFKNSVLWSTGHGRECSPAYTGWNGDFHRALNSAMWTFAVETCGCRRLDVASVRR